jgi:hypothetical protein
VSTPINRARWERYRDTIEDCLRDGYAPYGQKGAASKGSAVEEAQRRLGIKTVGALGRWVRTQEGRADAGRSHCLPNWALFRKPGPSRDTEADRRDVRDAGFWKQEAITLRKLLADNEHELREIAGLMDRSVVPPSWVLPSKGRKHRAAGLLHLSDLHVGEIVRPEEIGGLNEYNPEVFVRRIRRAFAATIEILPRWSTDCSLAGIVVAINGDLVSGDIHDELRRTNGLTAHEQVYLATDELAAGLTKLAEAFGSVLAVFTPGNHGRTTERTHAKRTSALSYDTLIGEQLRRHFSDDKRVVVNIAAGPDAVYPLLGWTVFQSHGDALGTGGGKGFAGPVLPIARGTKHVELQAARVRRHYDIVLTAHYHTKSNPRGEAFSNGSVIGYSEYANRIRADVEPPQQWLLLVTEKWGVREQCSIKLEDPIPPQVPRVRVPAKMGDRYQ